MHFNGMPIDQTGRYEISLKIDGTLERATVSLDVIQAEASLGRHPMHLPW